MDNRELISLALEGALGNFNARLATLSYSKVRPLEEIRDAIGIDQFVSKVGAGKIALQCLNALGFDGISSLTAIHYGCWFGGNEVWLKTICKILPNYVPTQSVFLDIDEAILPIALKLHSGEISCQDMCDPIVNFTPTSRILVFVNTAMEHLTPIQASCWFSQTDKLAATAEGAVWILQGTDMQAEDHHRPIRSATELMNGFNWVDEDYTCESVHQLKSPAWAHEGFARRYTLGISRKVHKNF